MKNQKITKDITLENLLKIKGTEKVLEKFNFPCLSCPMAQYETGVLKLGDVCKNYGIDLEKILELFID